MFITAGVEMVMQLHGLSSQLLREFFAKLPGTLSLQSAAYRSRFGLVDESGGEVSEK